MVQDRLNMYICQSDKTVLDAMRMIDDNAARIVYVTDIDKKMIGCLSDGDIRRWIINANDISERVANVMNKHPRFVRVSERDNAYNLIKKNRIGTIPVLDNDNHIVDIVFRISDTPKTKCNKKLAEVDLIIMAGGKGARLYPYTKILPKPLIPIGEVPILERILKRFAEGGIRRCYLVLNYKKEMIKSYFNEVEVAMCVNYIDEVVPLGTAGGIKLIKESLSQEVIVTNCDVLIDADYSEIYDFHKKSHNDMTIVASLINTKIPYGVIRYKEDGLVTSMIEKPQISNFVNTGMYILNRDFFEWIPDNQVFHMTELADIMIRHGKRVAMFPVSDNSFLDMGEFEELKRMEERINRCE